MSNEVTAKELKDLKGPWAGAKAESFGGASTPDGDYVTKIIDIKLSKSKAGNLMIVTDFEVVDGDESGTVVKKFDNLESGEKSLAFAKGYLSTLGVNYSDKDMSKLPKALESFLEAEDGLAKITLKTKGEYQNIYFNGFLEEEEE